MNGSPETDFFSQVSIYIHLWGGMTWLLKISGIITLFISLMKVTSLREYWDKLGRYKPFLSSFLGILGGLLSLASSGELTLAGLSAYFFAGTGSVVLHEFMDSVKGIISKPVP